MLQPKCVLKCTIGSQNVCYQNALLGAKMDIKVCYWNPKQVPKKYMLKWPPGSQNVC